MIFAYEGCGSTRFVDTAPDFVTAKKPKEKETKTEAETKVSDEQNLMLPQFGLSQTTGAGATTDLDTAAASGQLAEIGTMLDLVAADLEDAEPRDEKPAGCRCIIQ